ncbi:carboxylating nicotinate-nucleotide diphosphorylase [Hahella sp. NBU794]|uniref:carboxylating nicotinate-nucleotide diphosphorylase n=1 Tax=Hahella sp. NBU794 TaxID=3422590 RepID=UPI003D6F486E
MLEQLIQPAIQQDVEKALAEDIGSGDITAMLIPAEQRAEARVITREDAIVCGVEWVNAVFAKVDPDCKVDWKFKDGDQARANDVLFTVSGRARSLLTAERTALNFLQTLSGVATQARQYADMVSHTKAQVLDTRKTLPGLRVAQKYAVSCGGCRNHRIGLWDAFLIKENHIMACGSIQNAIEEAHRIAPGKPVEVEVETMEQLQEALSAGADIVMLDNFSIEQMAHAVVVNQGRAKLEASGGVTSETLAAIAETGVDFISIGGVTKHCRAIDLSMRLI